MEFITFTFYLSIFLMKMYQYKKIFLNQIIIFKTYETNGLVIKDIPMKKYQLNFYKN